MGVFFVRLVDELYGDWWSWVVLGDDVVEDFEVGE